MRSALSAAKMAMALALALTAVAMAAPAALAQHYPLVNPGTCVQGYLPVCAVKKKTLVTYMNSCVARSVSARVIAADRGCLAGCPSAYAPVCATAGNGQRLLYGNICEAQKSGATDIRNGACPRLRRVTTPGAAVGAAP